MFAKAADTENCNNFDEEQPCKMPKSIEKLRVRRFPAQQFVKVAEQFLAEQFRDCGKAVARSSKAKFSISIQHP